MRVGITGGVGCGATEVAKRLESKGAPLISADALGHEVLQIPQVKLQLRQRFGVAVFSGAEINRSAIGNLVFSDEIALRDFNRIVHPPLLDLLAQTVREREAQCSIIIVDAALIFEWGMQGFFHVVAVVTAPLNLRFERAIKRSGLTVEQVQQRITAQIPIEKKAELADFIIVNDCSLEDLYRQTDAVWQQIIA